MKLIVIIFKLNSMSSNYMYGIGIAGERFIKKNSMIHKIAGERNAGGTRYGSNSDEKKFHQTTRIQLFQRFLHHQLKASPYQ